jgi:hypothetical protein
MCISQMHCYFLSGSLGGHKIELVAKVDVRGGTKSDDFWYWTGLAPDDSPLVMRDASTQEIYALDVDFPSASATGDRAFAICLRWGTGPTFRANN